MVLCVSGLDLGSLLVSLEGRGSRVEAPLTLGRGFSVSRGSGSLDRGGAILEFG